MKIVEIIKEFFALPKERPKEPLEQKDIALYSSEGNIIKEWSGVYFTRWSDNVYLIYKDENEEVLLERVDKGENMLLSVKNIIKSKK